MMKRTIVLLWAIALLAASAAPWAMAENEKKLSIVTTIFPIYDWVSQILGEDADAEVTMLLDSGADLHNFQPTVADILKISQADMMIYVGGESDDWVEDVLEAANNSRLTAVSLVEALGEKIKMEEIVEGMEHEEDEHDDGEDEEEADEHVWLSLRNAQWLCRAIQEALCEIDPDGAERYRANTDAYCAKLAELDEAYEETVNAASFKTILFGDRFPFRYLADDYGLAYYAAFSGCSAETEASFQTILFLARKVDELGLPAVLTIEQPKARIAETIVSSTRDKNQKILSLNSLQSVTAGDVENGASYLNEMEKNLEALREALN